MHLGPIVHTLQTTLATQAVLAGDDPAVEAAVGQVVAALRPALQAAAIELAEQAAAEVRAQLSDHTVDVVLTEGDPTLRVSDSPEAERSPAAEDLDARITLRLTPTLKQLIEDAARTAGDSVNSWVLDALAKRAARPRRAGYHHNESFDL